MCLKLENLNQETPVSSHNALESEHLASGFVTVDQDRGVTLRQGQPRDQETFQWMETFNGDLILMSLASNRYLRVDTAGAGKVLADSPGHRPAGTDGVRFAWRVR